MTGTVPKLSMIRRLEGQLERQKDSKQRVVLIDQLAGHFAFTNVRKAQKLLAEQWKILKNNDFPDLELNYHLHTAFIENQLYNYILSEIHCNKAINIVEERGDVKQQAEVYIDYAGTCINLDKMDLATAYLDKATKLLEVFPDPQLQARITTREGFLNLHYSSYTKAIELFLEAEKSINALTQPLTLKDYYFLTLIRSGLGRVYEINEDISKSVRAYLKVINMCESLGMRTRLSWHYLNVGSAYMALQDDESAESYFRKAIRIRDDISQNARAGAYANLGFIYFKRKEYKEALSLYNRAESLYKERSEEDYSNFSVIENWKAKLFSALGKRKRAKYHFARAYEFASQKNDYKQLASVCKDIASFYSETGDYKKAYEFQLIQDEMGERYSEEVNRRMLLELEVKYEAEKKKQEAEMLRLQATGLQLKALRAQMNPHFMYNALNSIQNYITSNEAASAAKYLAKFAKLMRQSLDYSDMEVISLEDEVNFLEDYLFINKKLRFTDDMEYKIFIDDEIEEDIIGVPTMIVQPYVENAIEHGLRPIKNGLVKLEFYPIDDFSILCIVEDNGIGRAKARELNEQADNALNHTSKGTSITEKRLNILHRSRRKGIFVKTIDLQDSESGEPCGTRVEIQIPIQVIQKYQLID
ncbi:MAG: histidine kinase [Bacteroidota bacterium]